MCLCDTCELCALFVRMETSWSWWKDWWRLRWSNKDDGENEENDSGREGEATFYIVCINLYAVCLIPTAQ